MRFDADCSIMLAFVSNFLFFQITEDNFITKTTFHTINDLTFVFPQLAVLLYGSDESIDGTTIE